MSITLKVGLIDHIVHALPKHSIDPDNKGYLGRVVYRDSEIMLLNTMAEDLKFQTLWHEVLHVICFQRNLKLKESELDALSHAIIEVLEANPWLAKGVSCP